VPINGWGATRVCSLSVRVGVLAWSVLQGGWVHMNHETEENNMKRMRKAAGAQRNGRRAG
jgi:hypothetical protein